MPGRAYLKWKEILAVIKKASGGGKIIEEDNVIAGTKPGS